MLPLKAIRTPIDGLWLLEGGVQDWIDTYHLQIFRFSIRSDPHLKDGYHRDWHIDSWHEPTNIRPVIYTTLSPDGRGLPSTIYTDGQVEIESETGEVYLSSGLILHKSPEGSTDRRTVLRWFLEFNSLTALLTVLP